MFIAVFVCGSCVFIVMSTQVNLQLLILLNEFDDYLNFFFIEQTDFLCMYNNERVFALRIGTSNLSNELGSLRSVSSLASSVHGPLMERSSASGA